MIESKTILVCDDKKNIREVLKDFFELKGFYVFLAASGEEARKINQIKEPDIVLTDCKLPGISGIELIEQIHHFNANVPVIVITAFGSIRHAVDAMHHGAYDYLTKPIDYDLLLLVVNRAFDQRKIFEQNNDLINELKGVYGVQNMIGDSPIMKDLNQMIRIVSGSATNVLIQGECGTGKELIAKSIHYTGDRRDKPFAVVDCATLPENLLESELFGYEKGAFTGAEKMKKGRIELAKGGSLFLDEIGEMSLSLQAKLLRVIQERNYLRIGGLSPVEVDFRLIAATNKNLDKEVQAGRFRSDLFYRLNVVSLKAPSMRSRKEDIPLLVTYFVSKICKRDGIAHKKISKAVLEKIMKYDWPGNVRELENCVERMVLFSEGDVVRNSFLHPDNRFSQEGKTDSDGTMDLNLIERNAVVRALEKTRGNKVEAAKILNIGRKALYNKIRKFELV